MSGGRPLLEVEGLTKAYPGVVANDGVRFAVARGEIHALLGENGAGKSTLVKMIYGLVRPDAGTMTMDGAPHAPDGPQAARAAGVGMVFQHFSLFDALDVAENVALGMTDPPPRRALADRIRTVSAAYGLPLDPGRVVGDLGAGERQRVEIVRCLLQSPRLLIMDEPTSVLTPSEVGLLFDTLRRLASEEVGILYISHKLTEIRALCDAATILRAGRVVATRDPQTSSARDLAEAMVGGALDVPARDAQASGRLGAVRLEARGLSAVPDDPFGTPLRDIDLTVRAGEVVGIGGVAGNGQELLVAALSGEVTAAPGMVRLDDRPVGRLGIAARRAAGLLSAPEERLGHAAAPDMSLTENALLTGHGAMARRGLIRWRAARRFAEAVVARFDVRTPGVGTVARALSGGNLQKFVIGREVMQDPSVLVVNQPTWGVDAQAAAAIRQALMDLAAGGAAVVVVSQDLDELMEICDRFAALNGGQLSQTVPVRGLTMDAVGMMLGGAMPDQPPTAEAPAAPEPSLAVS